MHFIRILNLNLIVLSLLSAQELRVLQDESFDPRRLHEPTLPLLDNSQIYEIVTDLQTPPAMRLPDDSLQVSEKVGYKVQVFATDDYFLADSIYRQVVQVFTGQAVEKVFHLPQVSEKVGYKVQVFATDDYFLADSIYRQVAQVFTGQAVEKVFHLPNYKIRVGNCLTREEAEKLLARAYELRYPDAWIVRTLIQVRERANFY